MTTKEILVSARQKVLDGWTQFSYCANNAYCAKGAIVYASIDASGVLDDNYLPAVEAFRAVIGGHEITWNDHPDRTHGEVLDAFTKAIEAQS